MTGGTAASDHRGRLVIKDMADTIVGLSIDALLGRAAVAPSAVCNEDARLVAGLCARAEDAYETLIQQYQQPVYGLVYRLLSDPSAASDITQEVFLKIFRSIGSFRGKSSLRTWIYRIAVNEAYNHRRWFSRHRQEANACAGDPKGSGVEACAAPDRSPFELAADSETWTLVEQALTKLNSNFRTVIVLRDIEEMSYEEIAAILDISLGTVKSRILRGREALRKILSESLEPEADLNWVSRPARIRQTVE